MSKICKKCKTESDDLRTIRMECLYDMDELGIPFESEILYETSDPRDDGFNFFTIKVCKNCRASWLLAIEAWFKTMPSYNQISCGSGIYVREYGVSVEISEEEWKKRNPNREPVRFKDE